MSSSIDRAHPRSWLYVPADQPSKLAGARERGADALIIDLEDAVAFSAKESARAEAAHWLAGTTEPGPELWVRINGSRDLFAADIQSVACPALTGIHVPKCREPALLAEVDDRLRAAEATAGMAVGAIRVTALIESAQGWLQARDIAAAPRVTGLGCGEADLGADLGVTASEDEREWIPFRMHLVAVSAAAGIAPPIGPVSTDYRHLDRLRTSTEALKRMGFRSRAAIHPAQVEVINQVFTPTDEEVARAREIVTAAESARARGEGVFVDPDGRMVDEAVVRAARDVLARAEARR